MMTEPQFASMNLVIFDLETTGWSPRYCEIIQIAAVRMLHGEIIADDSFETFVRAQNAIPNHIFTLTGISPSDVDTAPEPSTALAAFSNFVGDATIVAHNGRRFDLGFIRENCERSQLPMREVPFFDSLSLSRLLWPDAHSHGLDAVIERLGLSNEGLHRHNARDDVRLLAEAVRQMWQRLDSPFDRCPVPVETGHLPR